MSGHAPPNDRLKVEDALSYLDQVKLQFGNQPQIYNLFLDIMKEFKSQSIDTPGVIGRVSNLFKGHSSLIVGFNTFLPPGYKIEIDNHDHSINVYQPGQAVVSINDIGSMTDSTISALVKDDQSGSQPVEFNHAITYVNKIKNRFHSHPEVYKAFLEILHTYQKEQKGIKDQNSSDPINPGDTHLSEAEVYAQVAKLFQNQEDLLKEFGQFLPDSNGHITADNVLKLGLFTSDSAMKSLRADSLACTSQGTTIASTAPAPTPTRKPYKTSNRGRKSISTLHMDKKIKAAKKDATYIEAAKHGSLGDFSFFDKVRKAVRSQEVYDNFLRTLHLFNKDLISRQELSAMIQPYLSKFPDLFRSFKDLIGIHDLGGMMELVPSQHIERYTEDLPCMEIDYSSCKKYGHSYRAVPDDFNRPKCSGRTELDGSVLNNSWVSFPIWTEDNNPNAAKRNNYEEYLSRTEDERFQLEIVMESNRSCINHLEAVQRRMDKMTTEETSKLRLDDSLGGDSQILQIKAIQRIYGDKSSDIIDGLKRNPVVAVPLVLRRLHFKQSEWRDAQTSFNKYWREQDDKFYLRSLDHVGGSFKQVDAKQVRSKVLLQEIEIQRMEMREQMACGTNTHYSALPQINLEYTDTSLLNDATRLIVHHMTRQTGLNKDEKRKIKQILYHFVPDVFYKDRVAFSDTEDEEEVELENARYDVDKIYNDSDSDEENMARKRRKKKLAQQELEKDPRSAKQMLADLPQETSGGNDFRAAGKRASVELKLKVAEMKAAAAAALEDRDAGSSDHSSTGAQSPAKRIRRNAGGGPTGEFMKLPAVSEDVVVVASGKPAEISDELMSISNNKEMLDESMDVDVTGDDNHPSTGSAMRVPTAADAMAEAEERHRRLAYPQPPREHFHLNQLDASERHSKYFGNNYWYLFLRLHYMLCERLATIKSHAKSLADDEVEYARLREKSTALMLQIMSPNRLKPNMYYPHFLDMVKNLLDGNMDSVTYEETLRELFSIKAYLAFTMDKLIQNIVRQLQHLVCDESCLALMRLNHQANRNRLVCKTPLHRVPDRNLFRLKAEKLLKDENCFVIDVFNGKHVKISLVDDELCQYDQDKLSIAAEQRLANEPAANPTSSSAGGGGGGGVGVGGAQGGGASASTSHCSSSSAAAAAARKRQRRGLDKPRPTIAAVASNPDKLLSFIDCDQWCKYVERYLSPDASMPADLRARVNTRNKVFLRRNMKEWKYNSNSRAEHNNFIELRNEHMKKLVHNDGLQYRFSITSYKLSYIQNTESFLYKKGSMQKCRKNLRVNSKSRFHKFTTWMKTWQQANLTSDLKRRWSDLMKGRNQFWCTKRSCETVATEIEMNPDKVPFRVYNIYLDNSIACSDDDQRNDSDTSSTSSTPPVSQVSRKRSKSSSGNPVGRPCSSSSRSRKSTPATTSSFTPSTPSDASAKPKAPLRIVSDRKPRGISPLVIAEQQANLKKIQMEKLMERKQARKRKITEQGETLCSALDVEDPNSPLSPITPISPPTPSSFLEHDPAHVDSSSDQEPSDKRKCFGKPEEEEICQEIKMEEDEHTHDTSKIADIKVEVNEEEKYEEEVEEEEEVVVKDEVKIEVLDQEVLASHHELPSSSNEGEDCKSPPHLVEKVDIKIEEMDVEEPTEDVDELAYKVEDPVVENKSNIDLEIVIAKDIDLAHIDKDNIDIEALNADKLPADNDSTVIEEIADMLDLTKDDEYEIEEDEDEFNEVKVEEDASSAEVFSMQDVFQDKSGGDSSDSVDCKSQIYHEIDSHSVAIDSSSLNLPAQPVIEEISDDQQSDTN